MDLPAALICDHDNCGRSFSTPGALNYHKRSCRPSKRRFQVALSRAKELWEAKKRARITPITIDSQENDNGQRLPQAENLQRISQREMLPPPGVAITHHLNADVPLADMPLANRRCRRVTRMPAKFRDYLPQAQPSSTISYDPILPAASCSLSSATADEVTHASKTHCSRILKYFWTARNMFGLSRKHYGTEPPLHDPEDHVTLQGLYETPPDTSTVPLVDQLPPGDKSFYPYPNHNSFSLGDWYWNQGIQKSQEGFRRLIDIVGDPDFKPDDIRSTNWANINSILAKNADDDDQRSSDHRWLGEDTGWKRTAISISVPFHHRMAIPGPQSFLTGDLYHRSIVSVIRERVTNDDRHFHYEPYELLWKCNDEAEEVRVHGELYTSAAFLSEHKQLLESPAEPGCDAPRAVVALMFWSDETHLTSFGNAKLWPCYMYFGNDSKYRRAKPSCHLCNHVAYFQTLPCSFKEWAVRYTGGKGPNHILMAHCHREMFHEQWNVLLDDEFLEAYEHGILIQCCDGITRRLYPRIFTYSADHPEKTLISSIRKGGMCPCPRCLVPKPKLSQFGTQMDKIERKSLARVDSHDKRREIDMVRRKIYKAKFSVNSKAVEEALKGESRVPSSNAFSTRLARFNFNPYPMLVVDLMHEFEQGVWKNLFTHLTRMLHASDSSLVIEMDRRYRLVPRFGCAIRKFSASASEQKKMAARDYEDLLQCAMPVFDGLFPDPHNDTIQELLSTCAHWHALAKLRMHTEHTLRVLEEHTTKLGDQLRFFATITCLDYSTVELPREAAARKRRQSKKPQVNVPNDNQTACGTRRKKTFNMNTYKHHALGDYVETIRTYGTCDSYSTEAGELEHCTAKGRYSRTDRREFIKQMTCIERREARIRRIRTRNLTEQHNSTSDEVTATPEVHYQIGKSEVSPEHVGLFVKNRSGDPAVNDFISKLKTHLLPRIRSLLGKDNMNGNGLMSNSVPPALPGGSSPNTSLDSINSQSVLFKHDRMYRHKVMHINYTSYDVRRDVDFISTGTAGRCNDVMVLAPETVRIYGHPFWYARVLGIYHVNVVYTGEGNTNFLPRRLDFLWVRWYELEDRLDMSRLHRLSFPPTSDSHSFGFLDPDDVLRACHIIPVYQEGLACQIGPGLSCCGQEHDHTDWNSYNVNRFADRDMVMRYHWGLGVGHTYSHHSLNIREASSQDSRMNTGKETAEENLLRASGSIPLNSGSNVTSYANYRADGEGQEDNGTARGDGRDNDSDDDGSYDEYDDDDDDDYNFDDEDADEDEEEDISHDSE